MKKIPNNNVDGNLLRSKTTADPSRNRPVIANGLDVTRLTGVESGNAALSNFADRVTAASNSKANTITLTLNEANAIFANIAQLVLNNQNLQDQVFSLQNKLLEEKSSQTITIKADGGGFKKSL